MDVDPAAAWMSILLTRHKGDDLGTSTQAKGFTDGFKFMEICFLAEFQCAQLSAKAFDRLASICFDSLSW